MPFLRDCAGFWQEIGCPAHVFSWISEGVKLPFISEPAPCFYPNHIRPEKHLFNFVDSEIQRLIVTNAVKQVDYKPRCVNPISCVPKKNNKLRLICDLRYVNDYCSAPSFRYEDITFLKDVIHTGDKLTSVDLKDGFHHVPVHRDFQDFLGFQWCGHYYVWQVLPFGLSASPYFFCKTLRPVIEYLRLKGIRLLAYMDDILILAEPELIDEHTQLCIDVLQSAGWNINFEKSSLLPSTDILYIGYIIDSCGKSGLPELKVPRARIRKVRKDIFRALQLPHIKARSLARIAGQCISMCKAVYPGKLMLRGVYNLLKQRNNWCDLLLWSTEAINDLNWWTESLKSWNGVVITPQCIDGQMETDASHIGWGAVYQGMHAQGMWNTRVAFKSSNYRELLTVLLGVMSFRDHLKGKVIQLLSDNVTTVSYLNHMGGPSLELSQLARAVWAECLENSITLIARHLPGKINVTADYLSRLGSKFEWKLHPRLFGYIEQLWGPHTCDRFASVQTAQLPCYNSRYWDPLTCTSGIDALAQKDWASHNNFVNPPFRLLPEILDTISRQKAVATVIAPFWPGQVWFQKLKKLSVTPPLKLTLNRQTVLSRVPWPEPLRNPRWKVYAWRLSGIHGC